MLSYCDTILKDEGHSTSGAIFKKLDHGSDKVESVGGINHHLMDY